MVSRKCYVRRPRQVFLLILALSATYFTVRVLPYYLDHDLRTISHKTAVRESLCRLPELPDIETVHLTEANRIKCPQQQQWLQVDNGIVTYHPSSHHQQGLRCTISPIKRVDDFHSELEASMLVQNGHRLSTDHFILECTSQQDSRPIRSVHCGLSRKDQLVIERSRQAQQHAGRGLQRDVILLGMDSTAHRAWQRHMPKSVDVFRNKLQGVEFSIFNTVGDGTTVNLASLLTGFKETELPESRRRMPDAKHVDDYPWIWKKYHEAGYMTQYAEDTPDFGTFQYRLLGFKQQPTDHYLRTCMVKLFEEFQNGKMSRVYGCTGSNLTHNVMLDWLHQFYRSYSDIRKFSFIFLCELNHEDNAYLEQMDDDVARALEQFSPGGQYDNAILIFFADHGRRVGNSRMTLTGKYEERLPLLGIHLPQSLRQEMPELEKKLRANANRLVTALDIHATLEHIVNFTGTTMFPGEERSRAISLFKSIPFDRTCSDIHLEAHWCVCLQWRSVPVHNQTVVRAVRTVIDAMNKAIGDVKERCSRLHLDEIKSAEVYQPHKDLLRFRQSADVDGRIADLSDATAGMEVYRVVFTTTPGDAVYEASVVRKLNSQNKTVEFNANLQDISRLNLYAKWVKCLRDDFPYLRLFCICKDAL